MIKYRESPNLGIFSPSRGVSLFSGNLYHRRQKSPSEAKLIPSGLNGRKFSKFFCNKSSLFRGRRYIYSKKNREIINKPAIKTPPKVK